MHQILSKYFPVSSTETRAPYTDDDFLRISSLLRNIGRIQWSHVPRIYAVLRTIDHLELLDMFIDQGLTDFWLPFTTGSLPNTTTTTVRANFIASQHLVMTKASVVNNNF